MLFVMVLHQITALISSQLYFNNVSMLEPKVDTRETNLMPAHLGMTHGYFQQTQTKGQLLHYFVASICQFRNSQLLQPFRQPFSTTFEERRKQNRP